MEIRYGSIPNIPWIRHTISSKKKASFNGGY